MTQASETSLDHALLSDGLAHYKAGDRNAAEMCFRRALEADPAEPTALYLLGLVRFEAGDAAEAAQVFEKIVGLRPQHTQSWLMLANLRQTRDDHAGAADAYRRVASLEPGHVAAWTGLSQMLLATADLEGARAAGEARCGGGAPQIPRPIWRSPPPGAASARCGTPPTPSASPQAWTPDPVAAHVGLALALSDAGEAEPARLSAERASRSTPTYRDGWLALGTALRGLHDPRPPPTPSNMHRRSIQTAPSPTSTGSGADRAGADRPRPPGTCIRALEWIPPAHKAHANLSSLYYLRRPQGSGQGACTRGRWRSTRP